MQYIDLFSQRTVRLPSVVESHQQEAASDSKNHTSQPTTKDARSAPSRLSPPSAAVAALSDANRLTISSHPAARAASSSAIAALAGDSGNHNNHNHNHHNHHHNHHHNNNNRNNTSSSRSSSSSFDVVTRTLPAVSGAPRPASVSARAEQPGGEGPPGAGDPVARQRERKFHETFDQDAAGLITSSTTTTAARHADSGDKGREGGGGGGGGVRQAFQDNRAGSAEGGGGGAEQDQRRGGRQLSVRMGKGARSGAEEVRPEID
ncbi:MAG: hypothetical protein WDW36_010348 [Sanguina aurantia]